MKYTRIEQLNMDISTIVFGTCFNKMILGEDASDLLNCAREYGVNFFDTARVYGEAEDSFGNWLATQKREELVVLSKGGHPKFREKGPLVSIIARCISKTEMEPTIVSRTNFSDISKDLDASLQHLKTDYIDIYMLHRDDESVDAGTIVDWMNALIHTGKIKTYGFSNWRSERLAEAINYARKNELIEPVMSSAQFSLAKQISDPWGGGCVSLNSEDNSVEKDWYKKTQFPIVAYSCLAHGLFSGKFKHDEKKKHKNYLDGYALKGYYSKENLERLHRAGLLANKLGISVPQVALLYCLSVGLNMFACFSSSRINNLIDDLRITEQVLSKKDLDYLENG